MSVLPRTISSNQLPTKKEAKPKGFKPKTQTELMNLPKTKYRAKMIKQAQKWYGKPQRFGLADGLN